MRTLRTSLLQKRLKLAPFPSVHNGFKLELRLRLAKDMLLVRPLMRRIEELTAFLDLGT